MDRLGRAGRHVRVGLLLEVEVVPSTGYPRSACEWEMHSHPERAVDVARPGGRQFA